MTAISTTGAGKAVGEDAALKIAAEFALGKRRGAATLVVIVQSQTGGEMRLHEAVEHRAFGVPAVVGGSRARRDRGGGVHVYPDRGPGRTTVCPYSNSDKASKMQTAPRMAPFA